MSKSLLIFGDAVLHVSVGIGVGLEVSKILHLRILLLKEGNPFIDLLGDTLELRGIVGTEALIIAVSTSSLAHRTIACGARESCSKRDLLHLLPWEISLEKVSKVYVREGRMGVLLHTFVGLARPIGE